MGCYFILQGIFPTQKLNPRLPCLLHYRQTLPPTHLGSPLADILRSNCLVPISVCWTQSQYNMDWTFLLVLIHTKHLQNDYVTKLKKYSNFLEVCITIESLENHLIFAQAWISCLSAKYFQNVWKMKINTSYYLSGVKINWNTICWQLLKVLYKHKVLQFWGLRNYL